MRKLTVLSAFATVLLLAGFGCTPVTPTNSNPVLPVEPEVVFGSPFSYAVGESRVYPDGLVVKLERINDSRCQDGVVCIWEGELAAELRLGNGADAPTVILGSARTPQASQGGYTFRLDDITETSAMVTVTQGGEVPPVGTGDCRPSGCSGQICSDQDMASDCMFRPEYACYKTATCERQADGQCGWTQSDALTACLANPPAGE